MNIYKMKTMKSNSKVTNRLKEPSKFAIKFAKTVFVLGILFSVLAAVHIVYKIHNHPELVISTFYYSFLLFSLLTTALFVLGLRKLRDELKVNILEKSKKMVSGWGGKMYFVYLPEFWRYSTGEDHINREFVLRTANELEIPIIDIHREVFVPYTDPLSLFPFRKHAHYNAEGYRLVGEAINKKLKADGIIP